MTARIVSSMAAAVLLWAMAAGAGSYVAVVETVAPVADTPAGGTTAETGPAEIDANDLSDELPARQLMTEIARTNIAAPADDDSDAATALEAAIRQLDSTELTPEDFAPEPEPLPEPVVSRPAATVDVAPPERISADELRLLAPELLAKLKDLPAGLISDPIALGDTLFLAGNCPEAMVFYGLAGETELSGEDAAWVLLQTAHCQATTDPAAAAKTYAEFQSAYPDSPLNDVARIRGEMQQWYDGNRPDDLIESISRTTGVPIISSTSPAGESPEIDSAPAGDAGLPDGSQKSSPKTDAN